MIYLGLETSCDETSASLVFNGRKVLSMVVASSLALHQKTGGVVPEVAARKQVEFIIPVLEEVLKKEVKFDAIVVTKEPGLVGSLVVGLETAQALAHAYKNHLLRLTI